MLTLQYKDYLSSEFNITLEEEKNEHTRTRNFITVGHFVCIPDAASTHFYMSWIGARSVSFFLPGVTSFSTRTPGRPRRPATIY